MTGDPGKLKEAIGELDVQVAELQSQLTTAQEALRWIPVEERPPKEGQYKELSERVLCLNLHHETIMVDRWDIEHNRWSSGSSTHTHWRPIDLPEKDEVKK